MNTHKVVLGVSRNMSENELLVGGLRLPGVFLVKTAVVIISLIMSVMSAFYWTVAGQGALSWKAKFQI